MGCCAYDELQTLKLTTKNVKSVSIGDVMCKSIALLFFGITVISGSIFCIILYIRGAIKKFSELVIKS